NPCQHIDALLAFDFSQITNDPERQIIAGEIKARCGKMFNTVFLKWVHSQAHFFLLGWRAAFRRLAPLSHCLIRPHFRITSSASEMRASSSWSESTKRSPTGVLYMSS